MKVYAVRFQRDGIGGGLFPGASAPGYGCVAPSARIPQPLIFGVVVMNLAAHPETTKISPEFSRQDDYDYEKNG